MSLDDRYTRFQTRVGELPLEKMERLSLQARVGVAGLVMDKPVFVIWIVNKLLALLRHHDLLAAAGAFSTSLQQNNRSQPRSWPLWFR